MIYWWGALIIGFICFWFGFFIAALLASGKYADETILRLRGEE